MAVFREPVRQIQAMQRTHTQRYQRAFNAASRQVFNSTTIRQLAETRDTTVILNSFRQELRGRFNLIHSRNTQEAIAFANNFLQRNLGTFAPID